VPPFRARAASAWTLRSRRNVPIRRSSTGSVSISRVPPGRSDSVDECLTMHANRCLPLALELTNPQSGITLYMYT